MTVGHHVVRRGESLAGIAHRYGVSWDKLAQSNGIHNPNRLRVGQRLTIPAKPDPNPSSNPRRPQSPNPSPASPSPVPGGPATAVAGDVTEAQLRAIMPDAGTQIATFLVALNSAMRTYNIDTNERRAAFLAQVAVESSQLRHTEENLNYSAKRLHHVWPRRFPTEEAAKAYSHNAEALGNRVYASRLGNGDEDSGDGYRYRGRGLMQTTGRSNYRAAGFEDNPDALADPQTAADSAARFWSDNGLNDRTADVLDRGQFNGVSRTINGGDNGSLERWQAYQRALRALQPDSSQ